VHLPIDNAENMREHIEVLKRNISGEELNQRKGALKRREEELGLKTLNQREVEVKRREEEAKRREDAVQQREEAVQQREEDLRRLMTTLTA